MGQYRNQPASPYKRITKNKYTVLNSPPNPWGLGLSALRWKAGLARAQAVLFTLTAAGSCKSECEMHGIKARIAKSEPNDFRSNSRGFVLAAPAWEFHLRCYAICRQHRDETCHHYGFQLCRCRRSSSSLRPGGPHSRARILVCSSNKRDRHRNTREASRFLQNTPARQELRAQSSLHERTLM